MEELKEGSHSGEGQTGVGKLDYIVRQSFSRCGEFSVVDVCADTITWQVAHFTHIRWKVPHDRVHDRSTGHCQSRELENAPTRHRGPLSLSFSLTLRTFRCSGDLRTISSDSLIQYTPFKTHLPSSHNHNPCMSSHLTQARRTSKSRCSSKHFHLYSSSISSVSFTTQLRMA